LVFVVELTVGILGFLYRDEMSEVVRIELFHHLHGPYVADNARDPYGLKITWDNMQQQFDCCGVDGYSDWFRSSRWPKNDWVPDSCCNPSVFKSLDVLENCGKMAKPNLWYQKGCYVAFSDWLLEHLHVVGIIGLLLSFIQIFALIASILLYCGVRERHSAIRRAVNKSYSPCSQQEDEQSRPAWDTVS